MNAFTAGLDDVGTENVPDIIEEAEYGSRNRTLSSPSTIFAIAALGMQMPVVCGEGIGQCFKCRNVTLQPISATPPFPQTVPPASSSIDIKISNRMSMGYIQHHHSHLPRRRPRANLKERAKTIATLPIPSSTPTSTSTYANMNVEGKLLDGPAIVIRPNQADSDRQSHPPPSFCQRSRHISTCSSWRDAGTFDTNWHKDHILPESLNSSAWYRSKGYLEPYRNHPLRVCLSHSPPSTP